MDLASPAVSGMSVYANGLRRVSERISVHNIVILLQSRGHDFHYIDPRSISLWFLFASSCLVMFQHSINNIIGCFFFTCIHENKIYISALKAKIYIIEYNIYFIIT